MRHTTSQELEIARVYADTKATIFGFVFKAKVVKKKKIGGIASDRLDLTPAIF